MSKPLDPKALFQDALERPRGDRAAFLDAACDGDPVLRARVVALLAADELAGPFLSSPTGGAGDVSAPQERAGDVVGHFKLRQQIGEGGFGIVWMAEQQEPVRRQVALKIVKRGMDTRSVVARFEQERQALAMMDHPNIAKVFDGGETPAGLPYFAMELVRGVPITAYCDEQHLDAKERLSLFVLVCQAVQHAHQKGIIHRDIKPSNVLVTRHDCVPVPKVIDFGIAKAVHRPLTEKTLFTEFQQVIGTPEYMSPEQAELSGLDIDTRADIYSLGVLLYELLTGTLPFDVQSLAQKGLMEVLRVIREDEPPKPSTRVSTLGESGAAVGKHRRTDTRRLGELLRGDLDWIVMLALEKDRARRYVSADAFAADVQRHLRDEPVLASPPGRAYRLRKFVKRNRAQVIAGGAVAAALLIGAVAFGIKSIEANTAATDARIARDAAIDRAYEVKLLWLAASARADALWTIQELSEFRRESSDWEFAYSLQRSAVGWWLETARRLVDGRAGDHAADIARRPGLVDHQRLLAEIRGDASTALQEELDAEGVRVAWSFDDREKRWWNEQLTALEADLNDVRAWMGIAERCAMTDDAQRLWSEARTAIKSHPKYADLDLGPQLFLLPLGPDSASGFWEFAHLLTGEPAVRGADGKLVLTAETGLVFVLLPGGRLPVQDGKVAGPLNAVDLAPYLLSKYEMTRAQWTRIAAGWTGRYFDYFEERSPLHPADSVSWNDCQAYLGRLSGWVRLPSEAQWEYGCRAGTTTEWWTGADEAYLRGAANIDFDRSGRVFGAPVPVGTLRANPFGLHDVHGNLWEWCQDAHNSELVPRARDGLRDEVSSEGRIIRGGGSAGDPSRIAIRSGLGLMPEDRYNDLGLRPASSVTP